MDETTNAKTERRLKPLDESPEFKATCQEAVRTMIGAPDSEIGAYRLRNLRAYNAEPVGDFAPPDIEDRSQIVATDARDTVNWMMPGLMKTFLGTDNAVEFVATRQEKEAEAKLITEYINYVFRTKNPGFSIAHQWFLDALREKVGFVKLWWEDEAEDSREDYEALTEEQIQALMQDPSIEMIGQPKPAESEYQDGAPMPLFDVSIKRTKDKSKVCVVPCPPEEVRISRRARYSEPVDMIAHVFQKPRYELEDMGYVLEGAGGGMQDLNLSEERLAGMSVRVDLYNQSPHRSMMLHECSELYIRYDYDDDGITEWRKVMLIDNEIYVNEMVDDHPFVWICPLPLPHTFYGECPVDYAIAPQKLHTQMIRAQVDNINLSVNGRTGVVEGQVNYEDLTNSTPGGIVRMMAPNSIFPIVQPDMTQGAERLIEYADEWKENTTGFTRYSQGTDANSLNKTATGVSIITQKADMRMELISRHFAEGFKDLFRKMLKLITEHQKVAEMAKVAGTWTNIDPSQWTDDYEISINVGLGTGDRQGQLQKAQMLMGIELQLLQTGVTNPQTLQQAVKQVIQAMDYPQPELYYNAGELQPQQQAPNPDAMKAQAAQQAQQQQLQHAAMMAEAEHTAAQQEAQRKDALEAQKMQLEYQFRMQEMQSRVDLEWRKAQLASQTSIEVASIGAQAAALKSDAALQQATTVARTKAVTELHGQLIDQQHEARMAEAHHEAGKQMAEHSASLAPEPSSGAD